MAADRVIANLWQGDAFELQNAHAYTYVVSAAIERRPTREVRYLHVKLDDAPVAWQATREWRDAVRYAAKSAAEHVKRGDRTLIVCNAGLNRSGLIVAMALRYLGYRPEFAIMHVKAARGLNALSNQSFVVAVKHMPLEEP